MVDLVSFHFHLHYAIQQVQVPLRETSQNKAND